MEGRCVVSTKQRNTHVNINQNYMLQFRQFETAEGEANSERLKSASEFPSGLYTSKEYAVQ